MKNIGIPTKFEYQKALIFRIEDFIRRLRWYCFHIGPPMFNPILYDKNSKNSPTQSEQTNSQTPNENDETFEFEKQQSYGFKSENAPPVIKELIRFEEELYKLSRNIKFRKITNNKFQNLLKQTIRNIKTSKEMIVPADKSHNLYKIPVDFYKKLRLDAVTENYRISSQNKVNKVNKETLDLVRIHEPELELRVEVITESEPFLTVKDQKSTFPSQIETRMLNGAKSQLGKITKVKLQAMNSEIRNKTKLNQLQSSNDAISWFNSIKSKKQRYFLVSVVVVAYDAAIATLVLFFVIALSSFFFTQKI